MCSSCSSLNAFFLEFRGYYYDPNQNNYFKIPNYWDASFLSNSPNLQNDAHFQECTLDKLKATLNKQQSLSVVQDLENIALSKYCIKSGMVSLHTIMLEIT